MLPRPSSRFNGSISKGREGSKGKGTDEKGMETKKGLSLRKDTPGTSSGRLRVCVITGNCLSQAKKTCTQN